MFINLSSLLLSKIIQRCHCCNCKWDFRPSWLYWRVNHLTWSASISDVELSFLHMQLKLIWQILYWRLLYLYILDYLWYYGWRLFVFSGHLGLSQPVTSWGWPHLAASRGGVCISEMASWPMWRSPRPLLRYGFLLIWIGSSAVWKYPYKLTLASNLAASTTLPKIYELCFLFWV